MKGHTVAQRFAFLGKEHKVEFTLNEGYVAVLDRELLDAVRRDPGVRYVEDDTLGERDVIVEEDGDRWGNAIRLE